jgi:hypothetical protein
MGDPRLNSMHLEAVRRQDYRRAREDLLRARGDHTLYAEHFAGEQDAGSTCICIPDADGGRAGGPAGLEYFLVDRDFNYPLKVGLNTLGRSGDNDVVVPDAFVSRRHCAILVHHDRACELHDTASKNGTFLNGTRLGSPTRLKPGDEVRVCNRQFVFLARSGPSGSVPSPTSTE